MARAIRSGMVYVNCYDADDITVPFGGFRQSGIGRDKSLHAFDKFTELKTTWIDLTLSDALRFVATVPRGFADLLADRDHRAGRRERARDAAAA